MIVASFSVMVCEGDKSMFAFAYTAYVAATAERHAIKTSHQNFSESTQAIAPLTEEEKQAKLAELKARLAEKRAAKAREEAEERRQSEKIRRKTGQEISVARQQMEEKEMKKAMEAKRREKEADKLAKAKIKAQIEQDKKERQAKVIRRGWYVLMR